MAANKSKKDFCAHLINEININESEGDGIKNEPSMQNRRSGFITVAHLASIVTIVSQIKYFSAIKMHNPPQPAATRRKKDLNLTLAPHGKTR